MALPDKFHMCVDNEASNFTLTSSRTVDTDYPITNLQSQQSGLFAAFDMTAQTALNIYGTNATAFDINCLSLHNHNITNGTWRVRLYGDAAQAGALLYDSASECYANFDGTNDNSTTSDSATNSVTGDVTLTCYITMPDLTPAADTAFFSKWLETGNQRSFYFVVTTAGLVAIVNSTDGTAGTIVSCIITTALTTIGATSFWLDLAFKANNGASGRSLTARYSTQSPTTDIDAVTWVSLASRTEPGTTSIFNSTASVAAGSTASGGGLLTGRIYRARLKNAALDIVSDFDPRRWTSGTTFGSPVSGETWTLNNGASVVVTAETIEYPYATTNNWKANMSMWFDPVSAKSFQVDVTVASTINNTITIDKLFLGDAFTVESSQSRETRVTMEDRSIQHQKADGGVMTVEYPANRRALVDLPFVDNDEKQTIRDYLRVAKKGNDVLMTLDPNDARGEKEDSTSIYRVSSDQELISNFYNNNPTRIALVEN